MAGKRKIGIGKVVSSKMDKTVVVSVESSRTHRLYKRRMKRTSRFKAHDENNSCKFGDVVRIEETRPLSKDKRWRVIEILSSVDVAETQPKEIS
jgi:small subunit ribosomal protein S17